MPGNSARPSRRLSMPKQSQADISQKQLDRSFDQVVDLAVETLDPRGQTAKYAALGKAMYERAVLQKSLQLKGSWTYIDYTSLCRRFVEAIKLRSAKQDVEPHKYIRVY